MKPYRIVSGRRGTRSQFFLADCLDVLKAQSPQSVDVIVTSPPYNLGIRYSQYKDSLPQAEYLRWTDAWVTAA
ncbi:MAG: DNA methyltransferase, partial [Dehalococcoidia bacterium]